MKDIKITDIKGIQIGQAQDSIGGSGCSVVLCKDGAVAGVDVRGGGPATRETDLLNPINMVEKIHAVMLSGGSAFGLDAASGAMQYLEEHKCGFDMKVAYIPIVCGASLFDLSVGDPKCRPDKAMGYQACVNSEQNIVQEGNYGAGTGASVGKVMGFDHAMKSGQGSCGIQVGNVQVAALVAVNACGNVVDYQSNEQLAGIYDTTNKQILPAEEVIYAQIEQMASITNTNTTIGVIVTNAILNKAQCTKIAGIAHNGYARSIHPVHTMSDGDTIFVVSTGEVEANLDAIGVMACDVMAKAVNRAVKETTGAYGLLSYQDLHE
ncbi:P1 family peptidase [Amedibacillus sp. YH-ame10]